MQEKSAHYGLRMVKIIIVRHKKKLVLLLRTVYDISKEAT